VSSGTINCDNGRDTTILFLASDASALAFKQWELYNHFVG